MMCASLWYLLGRRLVGFSLLWWLLTSGATDSWPAGLIMVPLAVLLSLALRPPVPWQVSLLAALAFIPFFLQQSIRGGIDVAGRAFSARLPLDPALLEYPLSLPRGTARIFLLNTISLLPGTLSADLVEDRLIVHCLDTDTLAADDLHRLEARVAALFMLAPSGGAND
jgi:multicomponent Na+:H+ antiporter subunit E